MPTESAQAAYIEALEKQVDQLSNEVKRLNEMVRLLTQNLYGRSKETLVPAEQISLFDDTSQKKSDKPALTVHVVKSYRRKKTKGRKQAILDQFPQEDVYHDLEATETGCQTCHHALKKIGQTLVHRELEFIPAVLRCRNHYQASYKCEPCSDQALTDRFVKAHVPAWPIDNSYGSPSVIAETMFLKYVLKVPAYRQEPHWRQMRLPLSRSVICAWHISVCDTYLAYIYQALHDTLVQQDIVHADETTFRVLDSDKKQSYYWVLQSSKHHPQPVVYYAFRDGRGADMFASVIDTFKGVIHCDMYTVYRNLSEVNKHIKLAACWAHLRRKFFDAYKATPDVLSLEASIVEMIDELFQLEADWVTLSYSERYTQRLRRLKPRMNRLFELIEQTASFTVEGSLFATAIHYALNHREHFYTILDDGRLELSNNAAERMVKQVVMGRKNQLFAKSFGGAQAGAILLTLIETAKQHGLHAKSYLEYLLTHLPNEPSLATADLTAYMPWSEAVQAACALTPIQTHPH